MARSRFEPPVAVTAEEWHYLKRRFRDDADEQRARLEDTLQRLVRLGKDLTPVHDALMQGIDERDRHVLDRADERDVRERDARVTRARRELDRLLTSLRWLSRDEPDLTDDALLAQRERFLQSFSDEVARLIPDTPRKPGRKRAVWTQVTDDALRRAGVSPTYRRALLVDIGFVADE